MKLKIDNNWENLTYLWNKEDVTKKIKKVQVLWPNKTESWHQVKWIEKSVTVHDMGHQYPVAQDIAEITVFYNGYKIPIDIQELKVTDIKI